MKNTLHRFVIDITPNNEGGFQVNLGTENCSETVLATVAAQFCTSGLKFVADAMLHNGTRCTASEGLPLMDPSSTSNADRTEKWQRLREWRKMHK